MEERGSLYVHLLGNPEAERLFERLDTDWRMIVKCIIQK
jgi:hypothetical protein